MRFDCGNFCGFDMEFPGIWLFAAKLLAELFGQLQVQFPEQDFGFPGAVTIQTLKLTHHIPGLGRQVQEREHARGGFRHIGLQRNRETANEIGERGNRCMSVVWFRFNLRPGLHVLKEFIAPIPQSQDKAQGVAQFHIFQGLGNGIAIRLTGRNEVLMFLGQIGVLDFALKILEKKDQSTIDQVADVVKEVGVNALKKLFPIKG